MIGMRVASDQLPAKERRSEPVGVVRQPTRKNIVAENKNQWYSQFAKEKNQVIHLLFGVHHHIPFWAPSQSISTGWLCHPLRHANGGTSL